MGFLDFLRGGQQQAQSALLGDVQPQQGRTFQGDFGLPDDHPITRQYGDPGELQTAPVMAEQPGLLSRAWDWAKSPDGRVTIGTGLKSAGGDDDAVDSARAVRSQMAAQQKEARALEERTKKNAAFRQAYAGGKFDPAAYMAGLEGTDVDATEGLETARKLAPQGGIDGGFSYTRDPLSGQTEWGEQRGMSYEEEAAQERAAELDEYRKEQIRLSEERLAQGGERIGITRQREGRMAAGGGHGGGQGVRARSYGLDDVDW